MIRLYASLQNISASMTADEKITTGIVGKTIYVDTTEEWENLSIIAVCKGSKVVIDETVIDGQFVLPHEVLTKPYGRLVIGLYGFRVDEEGNKEIVIPTIYADLGMILEGSKPSGESTQPESATLWEQTISRVKDAEDRLTADEAEIASIAEHNDEQDTAIADNAAGIAENKSAIAGAVSTAESAKQIALTADSHATELAYIVQDIDEICADNTTRIDRALGLIQDVDETVASHINNANIHVTAELKTAVAENTAAVAQHTTAIAEASQKADEAKQTAANVDSSVTSLAGAMQDIDDACKANTGRINTAFDILQDHTDNAAIHMSQDDRQDLDGLLADKHTHGNKTVIDGITAEDIEKWNSGGSGKSLFCVHFTLDDDDEAVTDHTYDEIVAAYNAGQLVYGDLSALNDGYESTFAPAIVMDGDGEIDFRYSYINHNGIFQSSYAIIYDDNTTEWYVGSDSRAVTDVQVNGKTVRVGGVANIPLAKAGTSTDPGAGVASFYGTVFSISTSGRVSIKNTTATQINNRTTGIPVTAAMIDSAVKAALTDAKSVAYTDDEKAKVKEKFGISDGGGGGESEIYTTLEVIKEDNNNRTIRVHLNGDCSEAVALRIFRLPTNARNKSEGGWIPIVEDFGYACIAESTIDHDEFGEMTYPDVPSWMLNGGKLNPRKAITDGERIMQFVNFTGENLVNPLIKPAVEDGEFVFEDGNIFGAKSKKDRQIQCLTIAFALEDATGKIIGKWRNVLDIYKNGKTLWTEKRTFRKICFRVR